MKTTKQASAKKTVDKKKTAKKKTEKPKLSPNHKPAEMSLEDWQRELRAQAARKELLGVRPVDGGREGYFKVVNPATEHTYSVVFRGRGSSWNFCSCPDFRTNRLGTCKHIEAVAEADNGKYAGKHYAVPDRTSVYVDYRGPRGVRIRIGGPHPRKIRSLASEYFDSDGCLIEEMVDGFYSFLQRAREIDPSLKCSADALDLIVRKREYKLRCSIAENSDDLTEGLLKVDLYSYQKQGAVFAFRQGRVVIADEMGLGKTIQAIAAAMLFRRHKLAQSVWIICPTSLKYQWKKEIEKFTGEDALVVEGNLKRRLELLANDKSFFKIISYHSLVNAVRYGISVNPDMIVYDEVQRLKNWDTKMSKTMRGLKSDYVVALSGTPLENKLMDLYSVMQMVDQYALGPYWQFVDETTDTDETGRVTGYKNLNRVGERLIPVLIRRLKKDVRLQMPARTDKNLFVPVTKEQMAVHDDCKSNLVILINRWRRLGFLPEKDRLRLMKLLTTMRMVADSTYVVDQATRFDTKVDEAVAIVRDIVESGDEKVVIFSQWERMQRIVAAELEVAGIGHRVLNGMVPSVKRGRLIEEFMTDPDCRVFLSTDAGSTGLNLQAASTVINLDLPWNPAVLEQRIARVFRIGQVRQVQVVNMVSTGTIEERMLATLAFKTGLFEGVLDGGEDSVVLSDAKFEKVVQLVESSVDEDCADCANEAPATSGADVDELLDESEETDYEEMADDDDFTDMSDNGGENASDTDDIAADENGQQDEDSSSDEPHTENEAPSTDEPHSEDDEDAGDRHADEGLPGAHASGQDGHSDRHPQGEPSATELMAKGIDFFSGLAKALATPESRKKIVDEFVKEDPATGRASISIPVADKSAVAGIIDMAAAFFSALKR